MKLHTLLLMFVLAIIVAFTTLNWTAFITPTALSLGFTHIQMPLGLVMLGLMLFLLVIFLFFVTYMQTLSILEVRNHSRELKFYKELADKAEVSRFTELRTYLENKLSEHENLHMVCKSEIIAKIEQTGNDLKTLMEETGNTLAAYIGEMDDRMENKNQEGNKT